MINEPAHDKTYNKSCETSKDSDQPAYPRSLIRIFADRMCRLQPPAIQREINKNLAKLGGLNDDLSFCWSHKYYCRFRHALVHIRAAAWDNCVNMQAGLSVYLEHTEGTCFRSDVRLLLRHISESIFFYLALYTKEVNLQTFVMI